MQRVGAITVLLMSVFASAATAQSSSLMRLPGRKAVDANGSTTVGRVNSGEWSFVQPADEVRPMTRTVERVSLIAVPGIPPRKFKPNDLVTIIVREMKKYEADAKYDAEKKWKLDATLSDWFRFYPHGHLGQDKLSNGDPGAKFDLKHKYETEGQNERRDRFETRITARVIDVKPNGNLVLEAKRSERHDEEENEITLTGICRGEDVTPDNTVLSTQVAEVVIEERNSGSVRDATTRGWVPKILDFLKPF